MAGNAALPLGRGTLEAGQGGAEDTAGLAGLGAAAAPGLPGMYAVQRLTGTPAAQGGGVADAGQFDQGTVGVNDLALAVEDQQDGRNRIKEMAGDEAVGKIIGMALQLGSGGPIGAGC